MKQIVVKQGVSMAVEVAPSALQNGMVRVRVVRSCISPGTEMMGIASSGKSLLQRALEQPDKAKAAIKSMASQGVSSVLGKAKAKFGAEQASGYSAAGFVIEIADDVQGFSVGDRVALAGAQYANHAEEAVVPVNLAIKVPSDLSFDAASTVALGGIAMQGVRRAEVQLGDFVAVIGCGALGLLTVQMLKAAGCRVVAVDLDVARLEQASEMGAELALNPAKEDVVSKVTHFCNGQGVDRVVITAATSSNTVLSQAFGMSRRKGRVVLVGVVGPEFNRDDMYQKELDFVISTSYGPGRYDERYERFGQDYPYGYVRWTEKRNMEAYLNLLATGQVDVESLVGGVFSIDDAEAAYASLKGENKPLLVLFSYGDSEDIHTEETKGTKFTTEDTEYTEGAEAEDRGSRAENSEQDSPSTKWTFPEDGLLKVGIVGAGSFVQGMHLPNLKNLSDQYRVIAVCNQTGLSARKVAQRTGPDCKEFTNPDELLACEDVDVVLIGTRHNLHADLALKAIDSGKGVFLEKPLCLTIDECDQIEAALQKNPVPFMVGYNRRFSPFAVAIRQATANRVNPLMIHYTMNAGFLPKDHWTQSFEGGGRIIGEGCHIIDLFQSLVSAPVVSVSVDAIRPQTGSVQSSDNVIVTLQYKDGSVCSLLYTGQGNAGMAKERMEVFCDGASCVLDDYRELIGFGMPSLKMKQQDKGHLNEWRGFYQSVKSGRQFPIAWEQLKETFLLSFQVAQAVRGI